MTWAEIAGKFYRDKNEFERIFKCLNNKQKLLPKTFQNHITNIVRQYNNLVNIYKSNLENLLYIQKCKMTKDIKSVND